jgi:hypothetical protein
MTTRQKKTMDLKKRLNLMNKKTPPKQILNLRKLKMALKKIKMILRKLKINLTRLRMIRRKLKKNLRK